MSTFWLAKIAPNSSARAPQPLRNRAHGTQQEQNDFRRERVPEGNKQEHPGRMDARDIPVQSNFRS
jgi:hypothetical protein